MAAEKGIKILSDNRQAGHNYFLDDRFEAGIVLTGTEVKSLRGGKCQLRDAYVEIVGGEGWLVNAHISEYSHGNIMNHLPERRRKLLLHKGEIDKLHGKTREKGFSLIPTKIYLTNGRVKVEFALAKGKKLHDKREDMKTKDSNREMSQALKYRNRD